MPLVPELRVPRIEFYEMHLPPWTVNAAALGLSEAQVNALATRTAAARAACLAQQEALAAARAATLAFHVAVRAMHDEGANAIRTIRNTAESIGDGDVYVLAQIPPPAAPASAPPPGKPTAFKAVLLPGGAVELRWRCPNPRGTNGTVYEVRRSIVSSELRVMSSELKTAAGPQRAALHAPVEPPSAAGPFEYLGLSGTRRFTDTTLPAGTALAVYQVTAVRSTQRGAAGRFTVNLGVGAGGGPCGEGAWAA